MPPSSCDCLPHQAQRDREAARTAAAEAAAYRVKLREAESANTALDLVQTDREAELREARRVAVEATEAVERRLTSQLNDRSAALAVALEELAGARRLLISAKRAADDARAQAEELSRARDGARAELELTQQEAAGAAELQATREERLQRANTALREELAVKEKALAQTNAALDTARAALVAGNRIWQESVAVSAATATSVTDAADAFAAFAAKPLPSTPSRAPGAHIGETSRIGTPGGGGGGAGGSPRALGAVAGAPTPPFGRTAHMSAQQLRGYKEEAARGLAAVQAENVAELESVRAEMSAALSAHMSAALSAR